MYVHIEVTFTTPPSPPLPCPSLLLPLPFHQEQCARYWPVPEEGVMQYGAFLIETERVQEHASGFTIRDISITNTKVGLWCTTEGRSSVCVGWVWGGCGASGR